MFSPPSVCSDAVTINGTATNLNAPYILLGLRLGQDPDFDTPAKMQAGWRLRWRTARAKFFARTEECLAGAPLATGTTSRMRLPAPGPSAGALELLGLLVDIGLEALNLPTGDG